MTVSIYIFLAIYAVCLLPLFWKRSFSLAGKEVLMKIHFFSIVLLLLCLVLVFTLGWTYRGERTEYTMFLLALFSAVLLFTLYLREMGAGMQKYTAAWLSYPLLVALSTVTKLSFVIVAIPLLLLEEESIVYAEQPGSKLSGLTGAFMNQKNQLHYTDYPFFVFEKDHLCRVNYNDGSKLHKDSIASYRVLSETAPLIEITWHDGTKDTAR